MLQQNGLSSFIDKSLFTHAIRDANHSVQHKVQGNMITYKRQALQDSFKFDTTANDEWGSWPSLDPHHKLNPTLHVQHTTQVHILYLRHHIQVANTLHNFNQITGHILPL